MSLAPKWAKAAAVLGLKMQILSLRVNLAPEDAQELRGFLKATLDEFADEIKRIEEMPN
jgi:hypothetical protein